MDKRDSVLKITIIAIIENHYLIVIVMKWTIVIVILTTTKMTAVKSRSSCVEPNFGRQQPDTRLSTGPGQVSNSRGHTATVLVMKTVSLRR